MKKEFTRSMNIAILGNGPEGRFWRSLLETRQKGEVKVSDDPVKNPELISGADLIVIAVPLNQIKDTAQQLLDYAKTDALIISVCGLMKELADHLKPARFSVLLLHKMGRTEYSQNPVMAGINLIVHRLKVEEVWVDWVDKLLIQGENNKAHVVTLSPEDHDVVMARVQAIVRIFAILLGEFVVFNPTANIVGSVITQLLGPIIHRICSFDPVLNAEMITLNPAVEPLLYLMESRLVELRAMSTPCLVSLFTALKARTDTAALDTATRFVSSLIHK